MSRQQLRWMGSCTLATLGVFAAWRAFISRDSFYGIEPSSGYSREDASYTDPFDEEIIFPGVDGAELPAFDISSSPESRPIELELPVMSCTGPFVFHGSVTHSHPDFAGAIVRMIVETQSPAGEWQIVRLENEATVETEGRFTFRIEDEPPTEPGLYRLRFEVTHTRLGVDIESLPLNERRSTVQVAQGMVDFQS